MKKSFFYIILFLCVIFLVSFVSWCLRVNYPDINTKAIRLKGGQKGIVITIDLCPSSKPYEKKLFDALDAWGMKRGKSIPVYVCVAGKWTGKHTADLAAIKACKHLKIVWVNHSYTHPVENGFLDNPKINFTAEVYVNYDYMQSADLQPSKYFRFPGLIHNPERLAQLQKMDFVNLDADAWLGKGQPIKDGSIVLIHGNGNESALVVNDFIGFLRGYSGEIRSLRK